MALPLCAFQIRAPCIFHDKACVFREYPFPWRSIPRFCVNGLKKFKDLRRLLEYFGKWLAYTNPTSPIRGLKQEFLMSLMT
jgi:hypothetical protein